MNDDKNINEIIEKLSNFTNEDLYKIMYLIQTKLIPQNNRKEDENV